MRSIWKIKKKNLSSPFNFVRNLAVAGRSDIIPSFKVPSIKVMVYNGKRFIPLNLTSKMIGYPIRSYVPSTVYVFKRTKKIP